MANPHDHDHDHGHHHHGHADGHDHKAPLQPDDKVHSYYQMLGIAIKELLIDKGIVTAEEVRAAIEKRDSITPAGGAKVVARAWTDPAFKKRLLEDGNTAIAELGFQMTTTQLVAVENKPDLHNVIVCTLCSCYPLPVLGLPPVWYKSAPYRARAVIDPRGVLKELGDEVTGDVEVRVWDSTAELRYLVLPERPAGTDDNARDPGSPKVRYVDVEWTWPERGKREAARAGRK